MRFHRCPPSYFSVHYISSLLHCYHTCVRTFFKTDVGHKNLLSNRYRPVLLNHRFRTRFNQFLLNLLSSLYLPLDPWVPTKPLFMIQENGTKSTGLRSFFLFNKGRVCVLGFGHWCEFGRRRRLTGAAWSRGLV